MSCCTFTSSFGGGGGGGGVSPPPIFTLVEQWAVNSVPADQTDVALEAQISTNFDTFKAVAAGSITGLSTRLTEALTGGTLTVEVTINGIGTGLTAIHTTGSTGTIVVSDVGLIQYAINDLIGVVFTTSSDFTPTTTDLEAMVQAADSPS